MTGPASGRPKATVHFLGGAFAGASPQLTYPLLIQMLAQAGYTVVSTPYAVTFKHLECASAVQRASAPVNPHALPAKQALTAGRVMPAQIITLVILKKKACLTCTTFIWCAGQTAPATPAGEQYVAHATEVHGVLGAAAGKRAGLPGG